MSHTPNLAAVLGEWRRDAVVLATRGDDRAAMLLRQCADEVANAAEGWLLWLNEGEAMLQSGRKAAWFRVRREAWKRDGHAEQRGRGRWYYRACIVPRRANVVTAAQRGRAAAQQMGRAA